MRIGIDARLYSQTGIGRYIRNLIKMLAKIDEVNEYVVFLSASDWNQVNLPPKRWFKVKVDIPWHSFREQLHMPLVFYRNHLDLVHFPYFNVPLLYWKPFVTTLHDLTIWHQKTGKATTRPLLYYWLKKIGYFIELTHIARFSRRIITISQAMKKDIHRILAVNDQKISVIYEAVDQQLIIKETPTLIRRPYLLVVGNFYPHKNIARLIFAFRILIREPDWQKLKLILAGPQDFFYHRLKKTLKEQNLLGQVQFVLNPSDDKLGALYQHAEWLIFPSLAEGFGLPGLEALASGCPVVCSDIPVFHEIYQDAPIFFQPNIVDSMVKSLKQALKETSSMKQKRIERGLTIASQYDWEKCARHTLEVYESCLGL